MEDFTADIALSTAGEERLSGQITLGGAPGATYGLKAEVTGNLAPLLAPEHVDFFGPDVGLTLLATRAPGGRVTVQDFNLRARSLHLGGSAILAADGLPEALVLTGELADPDGGPVLLPFGDAVRIDTARFSLVADLAKTSGWSGDLTLEGLATSAGRAERVTLSGSGRIGRTPAGRSLGGTLDLALAGLDLADPALQAALGSALSGSLKASFLQGDNGLRLADLRLGGDDLALTGGLVIGPLGAGLPMDGRLTVVAGDLSRFALLAGQDLTGQGEVTLVGRVVPLSGAVDAELSLVATGLGLGIAPLDRLLTGTSTLTLSLLRDTSGTTLRALDLAAVGLSVKASGQLAQDRTALEGQIALDDLAQALPGWRGAAEVSASYAGSLTDGRLLLEGAGTGLSSGVAELDAVLGGKAGLAAALVLRAGRLAVQTATLDTPNLSLDATQEPGSTALTIAGRLSDLALLVADLRGPLQLSGQVTPGESDLTLDLAGRGPGQVDGRLSSRVATDLSSADLALTGLAGAALANLAIAPRVVEGLVQYDLRLTGPLELASLSGRMTLADGRLIDPNLGFAFEGIEALALLGQGQAEVAATARLSSGGRLRIDGPVALGPDLTADLAITLEALRLYDPQLFDATADGAVTIAGALTGGAMIRGAVTLTKADLRVPDSPLSATGSLPDITHLSEPEAVRLNRDHAGLFGAAESDQSRAAAGTPFGLDLLISAPNRIFLRGRGLDAELGGQLRLAGTSAALIPSGEFSLVRGRLDILGKRLVLDSADLVLEGSFVPMLAIQASAESDGVTSFVTIEGAADDPMVTFTSTPELPQEDVIARLLFGRGLDSLSVLQAVELANAVAVLAGQSGAGVINRLRQGFGLDDLDVTTAEDGSTALTVGKYLSENVYTEVEVGQAGQSRVNLNLDLRPGVTLKGRVGDDGETGLGIFVEGDY